MLSPPKQQVLLINISSVAEEMETHYLNICYTNVFLYNLVKNLIEFSEKRIEIYTTSVTLFDPLKQGKIIAEIKQKIELGNHNLFLWKKTKEREKSKAKKL